MTKSGRGLFHGRVHCPTECTVPQLKSWDELTVDRKYRDDWHCRLLMLPETFHSRCRTTPDSRRSRLCNHDVSARNTWKSTHVRSTSTRLLTYNNDIVQATWCQYPSHLLQLWNDISVTLWNSVVQFSVMTPNQRHHQKVNSTLPSNEHVSYFPIR